MMIQVNYDIYDTNLEILNDLVPRPMEYSGVLDKQLGNKQRSWWFYINVIDTNTFQLNFHLLTQFNEIKICITVI